MKHAILLFLRFALLIIALYAISNALKELLLREDEVLDSTLLVLFNVVIAAVCWSLGCWRFERGETERAGE
jgi:predicted Co/Zn/Cd cation transporter (cation efflux family)